MVAAVWHPAFGAPLTGLFTVLWPTLNFRLTFSILIMIIISACGAMLFLNKNFCRFFCWNESCTVAQIYKPANLEGAFHLNNRTRSTNNKDL